MDASAEIHAMLLHELVSTSRRVAATRRRLEKTELLAALFRRLEPAEIDTAVAYLSGELPQGRIGIGYAALLEARGGAVAPAPSLTLAEVDRAFRDIAGTTGPGSASGRIGRLRELLARATGEEQEFLSRLVIGELRQGALEGLVVEAIARASDVSPASVRRATMLAGDLPAVARAALTEGGEGLSGFTIRLLTPVQPMLAQTAGDVPEAVERLERGAFEFKLDGARIQVHRSGDEVRVFTRKLNDVTGAVPEVVEAVRELPVTEIILDGEVLALRPDGTPHPFQTTMRRFGRKRDVEETRRSLPLTPFFFDCLYAGGESLIDRPGEERFDVLADLLPSGLAIPRIVTADAAAASAFLDRAIESGHEGIMAKSLAAPYEAGGRGRSWLKIKPSHTLDLVVLAAEWGSGRRRGWLSNLHLGARDPGGGGFAMVGKTFKGLTDELLEWQTRRFQELEVSRDSATVFLRPELVVEIAFNDVQASPHYAAGVALRFARVRRYRPDKTAAEADTIGAVRAILTARAGR